MGTPVLLIVLLVAVWGVDDAAANQRVPRNVTLAGRDVGKLPADQLAVVVRDIATHYKTTTVEIRTTERTFEVSGGDLGLALDEEATTRSALNMNEGISWWSRPGTWLG